MIIPCMKSTSAGDCGGRTPLVVAGNVRLGFPGDPGCTITAFPSSACRAQPAEAMTHTASRHQTLSHTACKRRMLRFAWDVRVNESGRLLRKAPLAITSASEHRPTAPTWQSLGPMLILNEVLIEPSGPSKNG